MKKRDLAKLAMIGISAGMIVTGCQKNATANQKNAPANNNAAANNVEQMSPDMKDFYNSLSDEGKEKFKKLDAQHKMMAMEMVHQSCEGKNSCQGMGGCDSNGHDCAGQNDCKGQGGPPLKDADKAVDAQYENQTEERDNMSKNMEAAAAPVTTEIVQAEQTAPPVVPEATN